MIVALAFLGVVVLLAVLPGAVAGPLSWLLVAYLVFRAYPAVRSDLRAVRARSRGVSVPLPGRRVRGRGVHL